VCTADARSIAMAWGRARAVSIKVHEDMAEQSRSSTLCHRFFQLLRLSNLLAGVGIVGAGCAVIIIAAIHVEDIKEACTGDESSAGECYQVGTQVGIFVVIGLICFVFASLTIATEGCRCRCVARFFGFMAYNSLRGLYSIFCGLAVAWVGRAYKDAESGTALSNAAYLALFVIGLYNVGVGTIYLLFGCCAFIQADTLKQEFADYKMAMTRYRPMAAEERADKDAKLASVASESTSSTANGESTAAPASAESNPFHKQSQTGDAMYGKAADGNPFLKSAVADKV